MLRDALLQITELAPPQEHAARIEQLRANTAHTIAVLNSEHPIDRYTCAVFAFHLVEDPTYIEVASFGLGGTFAGPEFVSFLLDNNLLASRAEHESVKGDLIFYFESGEFRHVGRLCALPGRVVSKWGIGLLYEHGIWEVAENYGEEVRYFAGPNEEESFELFSKYAEHKGFVFGEAPGV